MSLGPGMMNVSMEVVLIDDFIVEEQELFVGKIFGDEENLKFSRPNASATIEGDGV